MQNPFTTTFSKSPENTYIPTEQADEIIENFNYDRPSESVYKITGVRGSGKTVILSKIEEEYRSEANRQNGWLVYALNPARDMLKQLASMLYEEKLTETEYKSKSISVSASVLGNGAGFGVSTEGRDDLFDIGFEIEKMLKGAQGQGRKVLIAVDEVSRTKYMVEFSLEFGKWLSLGYPVYMVCTGLYSNIDQLCNVSNLTFFRRATTIQTGPLNVVRMSEMYKNMLQIDPATAREYAVKTMGYAYAFQELGVVAFKRGGETDKSVIFTELKSELYAYSYEKIWEELTEEDRFFIRCIDGNEKNKREDILKRMGQKAANYSVYRDRLKKRGIIRTTQGYVSLALPFFREYVEEYGRIL